MGPDFVEQDDFKKYQNERFVMYFYREKCPFSENTRQKIPPPEDPANLYQQYKKYYIKYTYIKQLNQIKTC